MIFQTSMAPFVVYWVSLCHSTRLSAYCIGVGICGWCVLRLAYLRAYGNSHPRDLDFHRSNEKDEFLAWLWRLRNLLT